MDDQPQFGLDFDNSLSTTPQPTPGNVAGQRFLLNNGLAGSWTGSRERDRFRQYRRHRRAYSQRLASHQPQPSLLHGDLWSTTVRWVRMARTFSTLPATGVPRVRPGDVTAAY